MRLTAYMLKTSKNDSKIFASTFAFFYRQQWERKPAEGNIPHPLPQRNLPGCGETILTPWKSSLLCTPRYRQVDWNKYTSIRVLRKGTMAWPWVNYLSLVHDAI
jgi:hypothetical protein